MTGRYEDECVIPLDRDRLHRPGVCVEFVDHICARRREPVALNKARQTDQGGWRIADCGLNVNCGFRSTHVQGNQEFAIPDAALTRDGRAGAGREQDVRRSRLAALCDAVGIPGQHRSQKRRLVEDFGFGISDC